MARTIQRFNRSYVEHDPAGDGKIPTWVLTRDNTSGLVSRSAHPATPSFTLAAPAVRAGMAVVVSDDYSTEPPKAEPPTAQPQTVEPPTAEPPKAEPPTAEPQGGKPPKAEPQKNEPRATLASAAIPDPSSWLVPLGLALNDAIQGESVSVRSSGLISRASWLDVTGTELLTPGARYFLSDTTPGQLTEGCKVSPGSMAVQIGSATSEMDLHIEILLLAQA